MIHGGVIRQPYPILSNHTLSVPIAFGSTKQIIPRNGHIITRIGKKKGNQTDYAIKKYENIAQLIFLQKVLFARRNRLQLHYFFFYYCKIAERNICLLNLFEFIDNETFPIKQFVAMITCFQKFSLYFSLDKGQNEIASFIFVSVLKSENVLKNNFNELDLLHSRHSFPFQLLKEYLCSSSTIHRAQRNGLQSAKIGPHRRRP